MSEEAAWQRENDDLRAVVVKQALRIHGLERQVDMNEVVAAEDDRAADSAEQGMQEALARAVKAEAAVADLARRGEQDVQAVRDEYDGYREGVAEQVRTLARFCNLPEDATLQQCRDRLSGYSAFAGGEPFKSILDIEKRLGQCESRIREAVSVLAVAEKSKKWAALQRAAKTAASILTGVEDALGAAQLIATPTVSAEAHARLAAELRVVREQMAAAIAETEVERRKIDAARAALNAGHLGAGIEALGPAREGR